MKYLLYVLILTLFACGPGPSDESVAGFGSETTNGFVSIALTGADSYKSVEVQALPKMFNPMVDDSSKIIRTKPNDTGGVVLNLVAGETYSIYAVDNETGEKVFLPEFYPSKDSTVYAELEVPGDIEVNFIDAVQMLDTVDGYIYIAGYPEALKIADDYRHDGNNIIVNFDKVPEALIRTLTYSTQNNESSAQLLSDSVAVSSGDTTNVDARLYFRFMTTYNSPLICDTVTSVLVSKNSEGLVWIGTNNGLMRYKGGVFSSHSADGYALESNTIYDINESSDTVTWFATGNGISRLTAGSWHNFVKNDKDTLINSNFVYSLASTTKGYIWIGNYAGITLLHRDYKPWKIDSKHGLPDNFVIDMAIDCTGTLWGGTYFGYFSISPRNNYQITSYKVPYTSDYDSSGVVSALSVSQNGTVYIGTRQGLFSFNPETPENLRDITQRKVSVSSIITDSQKRVWFAVNNRNNSTGYVDGHLVLYDGEKLIGYTSQNQRYLPGIEIKSLTIDDNDNIYCGTVGRGLFLLGPSAETLFY